MFLENIFILHGSKVVLNLHEKFLKIFSGMRERVLGEVIPLKAEQTHTKDGNEAKYGAGNAIDLNLSTNSWRGPGPGGKSWLKITLRKLECVQRVISYFESGDTFLTWICNDLNCHCVGSDYFCSQRTLTVRMNNKEAAHQLPAKTDCKYGDTVMLEMMKLWISINEIAIIREILIAGNDHIPLSYSKLKPRFIIL